MKKPVRTRNRRLFLSLLAGTACLSATTVSAQVGNLEIQRIRQEQAQMKADYEARLSAMEKRMQSMETQAILRGGGAPEGKAAIPAPFPPLETYTRNLEYHVYARVGVGFTGNNGGQTFSFQTPDIGHGRFRLGNENDTYLEFGPTIKHILGDDLDPTQPDVTFRLTLQAFTGVDKQTTNFSNEGWNMGMVEAFITMKNLIPADPEVSFWAGLRFYDRYNIDPQDYFFLNSTGYGIGAENIDVGIGKLQIAYLGGIRSGTGDFWIGPDRFNNFTEQLNATGTGDFYRHVLDIRLGEIPFLAGKLKLVLLGAYQQGGDFTIDNFNNTGLTARGTTGDGWGVGGGFVQTWEWGTRETAMEPTGKEVMTAGKGYVPPPPAKKGPPVHTVQLAALYGYGLVDFDPIEVRLGKLGGAYGAVQTKDGDPVGTFEEVNPYSKSQRGRANAFWVWNPTDNFSMGTWATYQFDDQGYTSYQRNADGSLSSAGPNSNLITAGVRPVWWVWGPFAIQGSFSYAYLSEDRNTGAGFGNGGGLGVFTICPTIKPRGGYWTRPELRMFATYAIWDSSLKGAIGTPAYSGKNSGWIFGLQGEIWF